MGLKVFNTLGRRLEEFAPLNPPRVGIYVCGPTVYSHSHLGHAKSYVSFDTIIRWLRASGYQVNYIQNITDVGHLTDNADAGEDKIVAEARRRGLHPMAVAELYTQSYLEDMDALNVRRPDIMPRASGHVVEQIECAKALLAKGHAYEVNGSVYFDVHSFPGYGKLSGRSVAELEAGARVQIKEEKRHPADFALWKRAEPGHIMRWPSPWGEGYPGWHLECSVMSQKYIGPTLDIHGGGLDNQFPHHECEIAQAESLTGQPFCRYWLHNNMVTLNGQKMSKSLGNTISLKELFYEGSRLLERTFEPVVVRQFILMSHYRTPLDFSSEALLAAQAGSYKLRDQIWAVRRALVRRRQTDPGAPDLLSGPPSAGGLGGWEGFGPTEAVRAALSDAQRRFADAMNEDFNTAAAVAVVFELARLADGWVTTNAPTNDLLAAGTLLEFLTGDVLGLKWPEERGTSGERDALIQILVDLRNEARKAKNFALADQIRQRLFSVGIELRDTPDGTRW